MAKKLLRNEMAKIKLEIKNRYLAGETVPSLAKHFGVVTRTIYYHLGKLSPKQQGLHAQNSGLRKMSTKRKKGRRVNVPKTKQKKAPRPKAKSKKTAIKIPPESSVADFIGEN